MTDLAVNRHVAASTQNQALSALLFLYKEVLKQPLDERVNAVRAKKPSKLPTVLTPEEASHKDVKTTMIYTHVLNRGGFGVRSPLDD